MEDNGRTGGEVGMADRLSAKAQATLAALKEARRKWDRVHSLVERVVSAKRGYHHQLMSQIRRASEDAARIFAQNSLPLLAENAHQIAVLIKRGGAVERKFPKMRELVGAVRAGRDRAERVTKKGG